MIQKSFIDKCVDSEESPENISRYIKLWADSNLNIDISEYLGFKNNVHYRLFLDDNSFLYEYINKIKKWNHMTDTQKKEHLTELVTDVAILSTLMDSKTRKNISFTGFEDEDELPEEIDEDDNEEGFCKND